MENYTLVDLEKDIENIVHKLAQLRAAKGHDYSGTEDTLDNLREFGSFGVLVRLTDKVKRLKHFYQQGILKVQDEKIEDTEDDLINYALFLKILREQEKTAKLALKIRPEQVCSKAGAVRSYEDIVNEAVEDKNND